MVEQRLKEQEVYNKEGVCDVNIDREYLKRRLNEVNKDTEATERILTFIGLSDVKKPIKVKKQIKIWFIKITWYSEE